jgi:hypothetical protein
MPELDFGVSLPGKELRRRFAIENTTSEPWTLRELRSYCSCAEPKLPSKTVPPGETAWLEVTYRAPHQDTKVGANIMVVFDKPGPVIQLLLKAEVRSLLVADPPNLEFAYAPPGTSLSQTVKLHGRDDRKVKVARVETPEWLQAEVRPPEGARATWEVVVRTRPDKTAPAAGSALVAVHTDSETVGSAYLRVSQKPALKAVPSHLDLGTVAAGKVGTQELVVEYAPALGELTEKDLVVKTNPNRVLQLGDDLDVQVRPGGAAHRLTLAVRFQPKQPLGSADGELVIQLRKGTVLPLRVAVSGTAIKGR